VCIQNSLRRCQNVHSLHSTNRPGRIYFCLIACAYTGFYIITINLMICLCFHYNYLSAFCKLTLSRFSRRPKANFMHQFQDCKSASDSCVKCFIALLPTPFFSCELEEYLFACWQLFKIQTRLRTADTSISSCHVLLHTDLKPDGYVERQLPRWSRNFCSLFICCKS
jgi:hypothetical protein